MAITALDIISAALKSLGALSASESVDNDEAQDALSRLNAWIDALGTDRQSMAFVVRTTKTLTAATASYTIGTGGAISLVRPTNIEHAGLILDTSATVPVEIPISILTDQEWERLPLKTLTAAQSSGIYYDHNWTAGLGTIYVFPIPTVGTTQLVLYSPQAVAQFADLSTSYTFAPAFERMFRTNLALELAPEYGAEVPPLLAKQADDSLAQMKRSNFRLSALSVDRALTGGSAPYNIYSDSF